jgi:Lsr2
MATQTVTSLVDDLDGSTADRTVSFSLDGASYEIDLSKRNATAFEKALAPFVASARKAGRSRPVSRVRRAAVQHTDKEQLQAIRDWARQNGYEVASRGRISLAIQEAYHAG